MALPGDIVDVLRPAISEYPVRLAWMPRFSSRSIREGGASTLFPNGALMGAIRRFGRWRPSEFHIRLYGYIVNFRDLATAILPDEIRRAE